VNKSESLKNLATALHKAQGQIKHAVKDAANPFFRSKYADLVSVWDAMRDAFQANGLSVSQMPDMDGDKPVLVSILLHNSGEFIESRILLNPVKNDPQGIGSCISYYRRYALQAIAGVCPDDDDGEAAQGRTSKVDATTGEVKKAQPKWSDEQRTEVGSWFNAIVQGVEGGEKIVQDFRKRYQYTEPAKVIELAKELAKEHGVEP